MVSKRLTRARVGGWPSPPPATSRGTAHPCARGWLAKGNVIVGIGTPVRAGTDGDEGICEPIHVGHTRARRDGWGRAVQPRRRLPAHPCAQGRMVIVVGCHRAPAGTPVRAGTDERIECDQGRGHAAHPCAQGRMAASSWATAFARGTPVRAGTDGCGNESCESRRGTPVRAGTDGSAGGRRSTSPKAHPCAQGRMLQGRAGSTTGRGTSRR